MILLLSSGDDTNLDHVIEWLHFYRHPYLRINSDDLLNDGVHLALPRPRLVIAEREIGWIASGDNCADSAALRLTVLAGPRGHVRADAPAARERTLDLHAA
jgi:hypothetical protein